jgi:meso-butanediol dehydrogenase / (S,S)-butanediol dehydrogenase / diacetyl reductase
MAGRLEGKVAAITGAASGIGRDTALIFAREGATVAVLDIRPERAAQTAGLIRDEGGKAEPFPVDVSDQSQVEQAVAAVLAAFGQIDVLVNDAGTTRPGSVINTTVDDWELVLRVNLGGTFYCSRAVLPGMIERGSGSIVNIGSVSGMGGDSEAAAYNAAKGAIINLTRSMSFDFGPRGIRTNCICPGPIGTPVVLRAMSEERQASMGNTVPLGRVGRPAEVGHIALFLASDESSYVNGAIIPADGGLMAWNGLPRSAGLSPHLRNQPPAG